MMMMMQARAPSYTLSGGPLLRKRMEGPSFGLRVTHDIKTHFHLLKHVLCGPFRLPHITPSMIVQGLRGERG